MQGCWRWTLSVTGHGPLSCEATLCLLSLGPIVTVTLILDSMLVLPYTRLPACTWIGKNALDIRSVGVCQAVCNFLCSSHRGLLSSMCQEMHTILHVRPMLQEISAALPSCMSES